ncbi:SIS domain-containing protein [Pontibacter sp. G13]|uniref:SIS domain-containing protein n=1 Tax=Pontibacter sp. G13 TaxID=3074898 RepID=UPI00288915B6|nr:SIS domain-containing protein [Pontibacter sp. G13]WNJ17596.1 SIS domain-containing protein [Pontibacter sp. G13]
MEKLKTYIQQHIDALTNIPLDEQLYNAVELIHEHVHQRPGKVVVSGMGKAGHIGYNLAMTLSSTGTPAVFLHPGEAQHGDLGIIQRDDLLFMISNSGKTREVLELFHLSRNLISDIPIISLSGNADGDLNQLADIGLLTGSPKEICPLDLTPTTSIATMTVIGNLLVVLLMERISFSAEEYAKRHHSGYLGQKAKSIHKSNSSS